MRRKLAIVAGLLFVLILATFAGIKAYRRHALRAQLLAANNVTLPAPTTDPLSLLDSRPPIVQHLNTEEIYKLLSTGVGQEVLCGQIGTESDGLDENSYYATEIALMNRDHVSHWCYEDTMHRLEIPIMDSKLDRNHHTSKGDDAAISFLRQHPQELSELMRSQYHLGTEHAELQALEFIDILRLRTSCPDIADTILKMRATGNWEADPFAREYKKLCSFK
jgi:hypothetical protein